MRSNLRYHVYIDSKQIGFRKEDGVTLMVGSTYSATSAACRADYEAIALATRDGIVAQDGAELNTVLKRARSSVSS